MDMYNDIAGKSADEYKAYVLERLPSIRKEIAQSPYSNACKELLNIQVDLAATGKIRHDGERTKISIYRC